MLHHKVRLSREAIADIEWWYNCIDSHNGVHMFKTDWSIGKVWHVHTDASDFGYGALCGNSWFAMQYMGAQAPLGHQSMRQ